MLQSDAEWTELGVACAADLSTLFYAMRSAGFLELHPVLHDSLDRFDVVVIEAICLYFLSHLSRRDF
jgi:hypothetical protein